MPATRLAIDSPIHCGCHQLQAGCFVVVAAESLDQNIVGSADDAPGGMLIDWSATGTVGMAVMAVTNLSFCCLRGGNHNLICRAHATC